MITVRELQELLDKLPEDMPVYWVIDGKVPVYDTKIEDVPLWVWAAVRGVPDRLESFLTLGMHSPNYIKRTYRGNCGWEGAVSLYEFTTKGPKEYQRDVKKNESRN